MQLPLLVLFAVAVLSPEPFTHQPPPAPLQTLNTSWETHAADFIPDALKPVVNKVAPSESKPAPALSGMGSNVEQWRGLVSEHFPASQIEKALCVIRGESGGNPTADNPRSSARGLWQFLRSTWDDMVPRSVTGGSYDSGAVTDPVAATRAAAWLWANLGWGQWNAARRC